LPEKSDIEASKNEDFNKLKLGDLNIHRWDLHG